MTPTNREERCYCSKEIGYSCHLHPLTTPKEEVQESYENAIDRRTRDNLAKPSAWEAAAPQTTPSDSWEERIDAYCDLQFTKLELPTIKSTIKFIARQSIKEARSLALQEAASLVRNRKPILWNDDPTKHIKNVGAFEALEDAAREIESKLTK